MDRRSFGALMVATLAGVTVIRPASAKNPARDLETRLQQFKAFPGTTSFRIDIGRNEVASDSAAAQLFVASAIKTFIVCHISATSRRAVFPRMNSYPSMTAFVIAIALSSWT